MSGYDKETTYRKGLVIIFTLSLITLSVILGKLYVFLSNGYDFLKIKIL